VEVSSAMERRRGLTVWYSIPAVWRERVRLLGAEDGEEEEENCCGYVQGVCVAYGAIGGGCGGCGENAPDTVASGMSPSGKSEDDAGIGVGGVCSVLGVEGWVCR
jgi:hypothetical protein